MSPTSASKIPDDFPVKVIRTAAQRAKARRLATCGDCGRSWDDAIATEWTPSPSGRCPFEYYHDTVYDDNPSVRRIGDIVHDYASALGFLHGHGWSRKLANNTLVEKLDYDKHGGLKSIGIRLHGTYVVIFHDGGLIELRSGGWRTVTTKQRINQLLPPGLRLDQTDFDWTLSIGNGGRIDFVDGMQFYPNVLKDAARLGYDTAPVVLNDRTVKMPITYARKRRVESNPPRKRMKYAQLGSVSTGTLDSESLVSAFSGELESLYSETGHPVPGHVRTMLAEVKRLDSIDFEDGDASEYVDELAQELEHFAPPFCYFGASEGDGADFGFWVSEDSVREAVRSGEIAVVEDDTRGGRQDVLPKNYTGYRLHISDHGNYSLYEYVRGKNLGDVWQ